MTRSELITNLAARYPQFLARDLEVVVKGILFFFAVSATLVRSASPQHGDNLFVSKSALPFS
jgi:hypothetical protein